MATEQQIKELAYALWEEEGRPEGKDMEHYFRAKQILEQREAAPLLELPGAVRLTELTSPPPVPQLPPPATKKKKATRKSR
jgi:hypothetical protein